MSAEFARDERRISIVSAIFLTGLIAAVVLGKPGHSSFLPPCLFHALTGLLCPGCGTTRAVWYLVHGHPIRALGENALTLSLLPFLVYDLGAVLTGRWMAISPRLRPWMIWTLLAVVVCFTIARNVPAYPFTLLAPTDIR